MIKLNARELAKKSCDWELDTLLGELSALELQLTDGGDQALLGLPTLPTSISRESSVNQSKRNSIHLSARSDTKRYGSHHMHAQHSYSFQDNLVHNSSTTAGIPMDCPSPDRDSAFGDSSSTESRNNNRNCRNSAISCSDSCRGSLNTPSPTQQASPNRTSLNPVIDTSQLQSSIPRPLTANEIKAAKIREALEKMREANIKKIYVKFFIDDGSSTVSLLIDERWTVAECIRRIATKLNIALSEHHTIVEEYAELYIKRIYEDHEYLVENIMMWTLNSQNKLYFTRRLDKYSFLDRPEEFLITERNIDTLVHGPPSPNTKKRVIKAEK
ncbi:unnamed protein product [Thelazia callipaeda]|uniref:Ras-associating domain-containing protein n=1 Tax=Thelazia callipaeda TaxID=103827 RepID=A0A0N5DBE9_THECL|nr:unnamed protein product [Thelazia callipaeda]